MNRVLRAVMEAFTPKVSKEIDGIIEDEISGLPDFLDNIFRNSIKLLLPGIQLEYIGWERMTPKEEIKFVSSTRYVHDIADSNLYMVKFLFRFNKTEIIEKPLYLLYGERGNITKLSGTKYVMSHIISDRSISPSANGIFLKLMISKLNFAGTLKSVLRNGEKFPITLIHAKILLLTIEDKLGKPITPVYLYLLCNYGLSHFDNELIIFDDKRTIDMDVYNVYTTVYGVQGGKPRGHMDSGYVPHKISIAIKKEKDNLNLIGCLLYCLDMLPDLGKDLIKRYGKVTEEKEFFTIALARLLYKESYSMYRMLEDTKQHLYSLDGYLDILTRKNLTFLDIHVSDFFQLLQVITDKYHDLVINFKDYHNNLGNKYMDILSYISYDIYYTFNKCMLRINRRGPNITSKEVNKNLSELSPKKLFSLIKSSGQNLSLSVCDLKILCKIKKCKNKVNWSIVWSKIKPLFPIKYLITLISY